MVSQQFVDPLLGALSTGYSYIIRIPSNTRQCTCELRVFGGFSLLFMLDPKTANFVYSFRNCSVTKEQLSDANRPQKTVLCHYDGSSRVTIRMQEMNLGLCLTLWSPIACTKFWGSEVLRSVDRRTCELFCSVGSGKDTENQDLGFAQRTCELNIYVHLQLWNILGCACACTESKDYIELRGKQVRQKRPCSPSVCQPSPVCWLLEQGMHKYCAMSDQTAMISIPEGHVLEWSSRGPKRTDCFVVFHWGLLETLFASSLMIRDSICSKGLGFRGITVHWHFMPWSVIISTLQRPLSMKMKLLMYRCSVSLFICICHNDFFRNRPEFLTRCDWSYSHT